MAPTHEEPRVPQPDRARITRGAIAYTAAVKFSRRGFGGSSVNSILGASGRTKGARCVSSSIPHDFAVAVVDAAALRYAAIAESCRASSADSVDDLAGLTGEVTATIVSDRSCGQSFGWELIRTFASTRSLGRAWVRARHMISP